MRTTYIICTTPRSGSNYLGDLFRANGITTISESLYNKGALKFDNVTDVDLKELGDPNWSKEQFELFLDKTYEHGKGVICMKMMHYAWTLLHHKIGGFDQMEKHFGNIHYIILTRTDKLRQAISYEIAAQTKIWYNKRPEFKEKRDYVRFEYDKIIQRRDNFARGERGLFTFFKDRAIPYHHVIYEDLVKDYKKVFGDLLTKLHIPFVDIQNGEALIQADELNKEFYKKVLQHTNSEEEEHDSER